MKNLKKLASVVLALVMVFSLATAAFAEEVNGTIKITPPSGVDAGATNTYTVYKVFDAVASGNNISYKLVSGKTTAPDGFTVDTAGNVSFGGDELTKENIEAIADYVKNDTPVGTVTTTGTVAQTITGLGAGYYYITTSVGTVVAINSAKPNAEITDKNTVPTVVKKITDASSVDADGKKALAQVGTTVNYSADITIGTGAKGYVFHDTMDSGLSYNNDVQIFVGENKVDANNYDTTKKESDTFTVTFNDAYIETLEAGTILTVKYSATVTSAALTTDPANNTCYVSYGDANSNNRTPISEAEVWNAKFTVTKKDGDDKPLAGAGFVLKNAENKYYKLDNNVVTWVDEANADEHVSDAVGAVEPFTGLANGTYTLVEKTVPAGYNKAADFIFTIEEHDYTAENLEQETDVVNNAGTELPSTGGVGTTLFYVFGGVLVLAAVVLLVTKKRMSAAE